MKRVILFVVLSLLVVLPLIKSAACLGLSNRMSRAVIMPKPPAQADKVVIYGCFSTG